MELSSTEAAQLRIRLHRYHVAMLTGQEMRIGPDEAGGGGMRELHFDLTGRPWRVEQGIRSVSSILSVTFRAPGPTRSGPGGRGVQRGVTALLSDQSCAVSSRQTDAENHPESAYGSADRRTGQPEWPGAGFGPQADH
jgi:hypothetical protein